MTTCRSIIWLSNYMLWRYIEFLDSYIKTCSLVVALKRLFTLVQVAILSPVCYLAKSNLYFANFSHCPMCTLTHGFLCAIWSILIFYSLSIDHDGLMMQLSWLFKQVFKIQGGPLRDVSSQVFDHVICQNCFQNYCEHNHSTPLLRVCVVGRELPTMIRHYRA